MVGFAGETEEEFKQSLKFVKSIGFARAHIFPYSRRSGTLADGFPGQLSGAVKSIRAKQMSIVAKQSEREYILSQKGKEKPVLFEAPEDGFSVGYTEDYIRIKVRTEKSLTGQILPVKLTEPFDDYCIGEIIGDF